MRVIIYFIVIAVIATCKRVKKNRLEQQEMEMEIIEKKLQERRDQRRAAKATPQ